MSLVTKQRPSVHNKKRQAGHHRQNKHYLRAYWPYLPMLMTVVIGLAINSLWTINPSVLGETSDFTSSSLLQHTNNYRIKSGEVGLTINPKLTSAAQAKANDLVSRNYWSHTSPTGETPWDFIIASQYNYQQAGENLAYGFSSASHTVTGWMNSIKHRENILNSNYTEVGFGVSSSPNFQGNGPEIIVVAEYAQPAGAVAGAFSATPVVKELTGQKISRIQLITGGQAAWSALMLSALTGAALALFIVRHGLRLHKILVRGEVFISRHAFLDIFITIVVMSGFILTRSSGIIR